MIVFYFKKGRWRRSRRPARTDDGVLKMNQALIAVVAKMDDAAKNLKPWPAAQVREAAIAEGLALMLAESNPAAVLAPSRINARGEISVVAYPVGSSQREGAPCANYGAKFAAALSAVPRRCGMSPVNGPVLPENGWCYVNHFDCERIVRAAALSDER